MSPLALVFLIAALAGLTCALAGVFLVLRRIAMLADAISHSVLPGLVAGFLLAGGPSLGPAFVGAVLAGLLTVLAVETLSRSRGIKQDAAIGLVFPTMFALGVLWISASYGNIHLDTDAVLFGDLTLAPFDTWRVANLNLGPQSIWLLGFALALNALFLKILGKELRLATFDPALAKLAGFNPDLLHFSLMAIVSITSVAAFTAIGAVLAVALLVAPAAIARLYTDSYPQMLRLSAAIGVGSSLLGTALAVLFDVSISGLIATVLGVAFVSASLTAPRRGVLWQAQAQRTTKLNHAVEALVIHLSLHANTSREAEESQLSHLIRELGWTPQWTRDVVEEASRRGLLKENDQRVTLTSAGHQLGRS